MDWFFWESILAYLPVFVGSRYLALFHSTSSTIWHVFCALSFLQAIYGPFRFIYFYMIKRESLVYFETFFDYHATEIWHTWLFLLNPQKFLLDRNLSYPTIRKNKSVHFFCRKLLLSVVSLSEFCFFDNLGWEQEVDDDLNVCILGLLKRRLTL